MTRFAPKPPNDFRDFIRLYYDECRSRLPRIAAIVFTQGCNFRCPFCHNGRLIGEAPLPACIEDVKCAVRWLRAHADQYHVDPDRIGAYGHSAGAHLAVMLALCPRSAGLEGGGGWDEFSSGVTSVVGGSTVTRVSERRGDPVKHAPATYITPDAPPILMIHGTADSAVDIETADTFVDQLNAAGVKDVGYVKVEGGSHGIVYEHHLTRTMGAMEKFFERTLKNR